MYMRKQYLKTAVKAAKRAGKIVRDGFYRVKNIEFKSFANPVTEFDKAAEVSIVNTVLKRYPDHSILTEEALTREGSADVKWVIDPLDGTVNFTHQIPFICVSIGVEQKGEIIAAVIYNPILEELYTAVKGEGAYLKVPGRKAERLKVSETSDKQRSLYVTGFPYEREGRHDYLLEPLRSINIECTGFRRLGSAAIDLAYVARGSFEGFYEENLKPWDTAAGKLLVEEAGGMLTDYRGEPYSIYSKTIIASNKKVHDSLLNYVRNIPGPA